MTPAARNWAERIAAGSLLIIAGIAADRLSHLPSAAAIVNDRKWQVPTGHRLELAGPGGSGFLQIETGAGDGAQVQAGPATIDGSASVKALVWQVSRLDDPNGDNKVRVDIAVAGPATGQAIVFVRRAGTTTRPELQIGSANASLAVRAGVEFGEARLLPRATLTVDGRVQDQSLQTAFTVAPGGDLRLTFPAFPDGTPKGMTLALGEEEPIGPRLWLHRVGIVADGETTPWKAACAAQSGRQLWPMLLRGSQVFRDGDCATGHFLAATALEIGRDESIAVSLAGSAYTLDQNQPTVSRWFKLIKDNPILGLAMSSLLVAAVGWLLKTILNGRKPATP